MSDSFADLWLSLPEKYQVARKTRMVATKRARISSMRLEVRKEEGAEESSSSVPTPKTPPLPSVVAEACTAAEITALCGWERFADCWKVCCRAGWAGLAGDCDGTAWLGSKVGLETAGSPVARKLSTWVLAPAALKALDALAALLELVAEAPEAPETPEAALPGWSERGRVTWVGASEGMAGGDPGWDPGGETTANGGDACGA